jgi:hypothetical protein
VVRVRVTVGKRGKRILTVVASEPAVLDGVLERKRRRGFTRVKELAGPAAPATTIVLALGMRRSGTYRVRYTLTDASGNETRERKRSFVV